MSSRRGCEREEQVPVLKTVIWMKWTENGKGLGVEISVEMLLSGVEVRVVLSAMGAPESHSTSKTRHRMTRYHPFLNSS